MPAARWPHSWRDPSAKPARPWARPSRRRPPLQLLGLDARAGIPTALGRHAAPYSAGGAWIGRWAGRDGTEAAPDRQPPAAVPAANPAGHPPGAGRYPCRHRPAHLSAFSPTLADRYEPTYRFSDVRFDELPSLVSCGLRRGGLKGASERGCRRRARTERRRCALRDPAALSGRHAPPGGDLSTSPGTGRRRQRPVRRWIFPASPGGAMVHGGERPRSRGHRRGPRVAGDDRLRPVAPRDRTGGRPDTFRALLYAGVRDEDGRHPMDLAELDSGLKDRSVIERLRVAGQCSGATADRRFRSLP